LRNYVEFVCCSGGFCGFFFGEAADFGFKDWWLLLLNACSPEAPVVAQRCRYARRRLLFSASPEKSNQKRGDFFRRSNLFLCRAGLCCK
jgi:hypothetical protein